MPELPEAENIRMALERALTGRRIVGVQVFSPAMRTSLLPLKTAALEGRIVTSVRRRGRYVVADLDDGRGLVMHFGMSGVVRVESLSIPRRKHEHVFLELDDGRAFRFECTRRFSLLEVFTPETPGGWPSRLADLGPEPLSGEFSGAALKAAAKGRNCPVKAFVMDNAVVTGIGNIYATESLFAAGIDPRKPAHRMTRLQCDRFCEEAKAILRRAIAAGGSSISDFRNVDGSEGRFARELLIYGRAGEACPKCGAPLKCVQIGGRSSCFCPQCQK